MAARLDDVAHDAQRFVRVVHPAGEGVLRSGLDLVPAS